MVIVQDGRLEPSYFLYRNEELKQTINKMIEVKNEKEYEDNE